MKVACLRENLSRGLGASGGVIPSRTAMDILPNVLIDPWENRLKISGTNLETPSPPSLTTTDCQIWCLILRIRPRARNRGKLMAVRFRSKWVAKITRSNQPSL